MKSQQQKHRPTLTSEQISYIYNRLLESPIDSTAIEILASFKPYLARSAIGTPGSSTAISTPATSNNIAATKEQYWQACYTRYANGEQLSATERQAAAEHMYLHSLLTPSQVQLFELTGDII